MFRVRNGVVEQIEYVHLSNSVYSLDQCMPGNIISFAGKSWLIVALDSAHGGYSATLQFDYSKQKEVSDGCTSKNADDRIF